MRGRGSRGSEVTSASWHDGAAVAGVTRVPVGAQVGEVPPQALTTGGRRRRELPTVDVVRSPSPASAGRRRRHPHVLAALALAALTSTLGTILVATAAPPAYADPVVVGDDAADIYTGTGGVVIPSRDWRGDESGRSEAAGCDGCTWHITSFCTRADFDLGSCDASHLDCPAGLVRVRVWLEQPGEPKRLVGGACVGGSPPATRTQIGASVRDSAEQALPPLRAGVQPADGVLVGVPAVFRAGQPAAGIVGADLTVLGFDVRLDARPRWWWAWGDGTGAWSSSPGGRWPDTSVAHTYRSLGEATAQVTSVWRGEYVVDGLGPYPVPGDPLTQKSTLTVQVREARALLVG